MKMVIILISILTTSLLSLDLTLEDAKSIAVKNNLGLASTKLDLEKADYDVDISISKFFPSVSLQSRYTQHTPEIETMGGTNENNTSFGISLNQPLFNGGSIYYNYKSVEGRKSISENSLKQKKLELLSNIESSYFTILEQQDLLKIKQLSLDIAKKNSEKAKINFELKKIAKADFLQAVSEEKRSELELISSKHELQNKILDFKTLLKIDDDIKITPIDSSDIKSLVDGLTFNQSDIEVIYNHLNRYANRNNLSLKSSQLNSEISEYNVNRDMGSMLPSLNLSYSQDWSKSNLDDDYNRSGSATLSLSIPLSPIYDNYGGYQKSKLNLKQSEIALEESRDRVGTEIYGLLIDLLSTTTRLSIDHISLEISRSAYEEMEIRFNNRIGSYTELSNALLNYNNSSTTLIKDQYTLLNLKNRLKLLLAIESDIELLNLIANK